MNNNLITVDGYKGLSIKIDELKEKLRLAMEDVASNMCDNDFREDSRLSIAMDERSKIGKQLDDIEDIFNEAIVTVADMSSDAIGFGRTAIVVNLDTDEKRNFTIVGIHETNPKVGKISFMSPFGKALLGLTGGDDFEVVTPNSETYWEVLEVLL